LYLDSLKEFKHLFFLFFLFFSFLNGETITLTGDYLRHICISNQSAEELNITIEFNNPGGCGTFSSYNFITTKCDTDNDNNISIDVDNLTAYLHYYNLDLNQSPKKIKIESNENFIAEECPSAVLARESHMKVEDLTFALAIGGILAGFLVIGLMLLIIVYL